MAGALIATALGLSLAATTAAAASSLTVSASDAVIGGTIEATAQLSDAATASGEISFEVFGPGDPDCIGPALSPAPDSAEVDGEGEYESGEFTPPIAGAYHWIAHYTGDFENLPADSDCSAISTVDKASPGLNGSASSSVVGGSIHDEATVTGGFSPNGKVSFSVYGPGDIDCSTALATSLITLQSGDATSTNFTTPQAGSFRWTAAYEGDANNQPTSTSCGDSGQTSAVSKASPGLSGLATAAVKVGATITNSATLSGGFSPGGQIVFRAFGPGDPTCGDTAAYEATVAVNSGNGTYAPAGFPPGPGVYRWRVNYEGDTNNQADSLSCGSTDQTSTVNQAAPTLSGVATATAKVGTTITDSATLSGGFSAGGQLVFRAYGPDDKACSTAPAYEKAVAVSGDGTYSPPGFAPPPGLYRWTVSYAGDSNNDGASTSCDADKQSSAVGAVPVTLTATAIGGTIGNAVNATATIKEGAIPGGQITFKAFPPGDPNCTGGAAFSSSVNVAGNGPYRSRDFAPARVGAFRWTVAYSGDVTHLASTVGCGKATSNISQARPSIAGAVKQRVVVGAKFRDTATLLGGHTPGGSITFRIYGPVASGCDQPAFADTVAVIGNGAINSDPFVASLPGRYSFVASYSGDASNQRAIEPCDSPAQVVVVQKRKPRVKPRAQLIERRRISIRASLAGTVSPTGRLTFSLYAPGDKRCKRKPAFSGGVTVKTNGTFPLAQYIATKSGRYRLRVGYSGDQRNQRFKGSCGGAQSIPIK